MDTQEIQPETVTPVETVEQSEMSGLDIAKQQAQQEVDAFLSSTEFDSATKFDVINEKIAQVSGRVDQLQDDMHAELDGAREQFKGFQNVGYDQTWLDRTSDEIRQRYSSWKAQERAKIGVLRTASATLAPRPPELSITEEPAEIAETPITEPSVTPEEVEPQDEVVEEIAATEESDEKQIEPEAEEAVEKAKSKIDTAEILQKMKRNRELAEDLRSMSARIKTMTEVSPQEPWFRPLQRFDDEFIGKLNNRLLRIIDNSGRFRTLSQAMENGDPKASGRLNELTDELNREWRTVASILEDANHFMNRLRWQTEELSNGDMDRDHPVFQIGSQLRRITEELNSRRNRL